MEKAKDFQGEKPGKLGYINENCWLAKTLNYAPYKRCQYCEFKFRNCLFLHYQIISSSLIIFFVTFSFLVKEITVELVIASIFVSVIVYGYFFTKSTDKIIMANFAQKEAQLALGKLNEDLEEKVNQQTKKIKQAYGEIEKAYNDLKKLDEAKSEFISIASHQLRTPLSAIKGYISLILEGTYGKLDEKAKKPLENVYRSNERLISLVNNLLDLSRIEAGRTELQKEPASLEELLATSIETLLIEAKKKDLYLKLEKPLPQLAFLNLDKEKFSQAILNVIDNAIRYTKKGGITVGAKKTVDPNEITIRIKDTGAGMEKGELNDLFRSFSRGKAGNRYWTEGAGLGLYVAKKFVEMHGGRIWAESRGRRKGSVFCIALPLNQKQP